MKRILIVDDEQSMRDTLQIMLENEGFLIELASNGAEALELASRIQFDLIVTDLKMPELDGIKLIEKLSESKNSIPIIIMTAYATKDEAIRALNLGASFFIEKPFKKTAFMNFVNRCLKMDDLIRENRELKSKISTSKGIDMIIGTSKHITEVKELIRRVAGTDSTILITGESGTGKELVASAIHSLSTRAEGPFMAINCGAIPTELLESELFGHIRGSFTGAVKDKTGLMEMANGGSFFLDEVGNTDPSIQVKILRAIQEREIFPVGGQTSKKVDIRVIAATNENLEDAIIQGGFRKDLYYRLNVINIHIPALRERFEDIDLLFNYFLRQRNVSGADTTNVPEEFMKALKNYSWPGNVRELENVVERIAALSPDLKLKIDLLPEYIRNPPRKPLVSESPQKTPNMEEIEKAYINWVLTQQNGQKQKAAEILGIGRSTLDRKIEKYGLDKTGA